MDKNKRPKLYTLPDALPGVACLVSSADRCSVSSVWACVSVRVLLWAVCLASGTACATACDVQAVRVRWRVQGDTGGAYSRRPAPPGQSRHHRKNKKDQPPPSQTKTHPIVQVSKNSKKYKKAPLWA